MKIEAIPCEKYKYRLSIFSRRASDEFTTAAFYWSRWIARASGGWAECVAAEDPFYSSEWIESAWPTLTKYLAPALVGKTVSQGREAAALLSKIRGHRMAKAALENALWDAEAQAKKSPCGSCWAGRAARFLAGFPSAFRTRIEQLLEKIAIEIAGRLPSHQAQGETRLGRQRSREGPARWPDITLSWTRIPPTRSTSRSTCGSSTSSTC